MSSGLKIDKDNMHHNTLKVKGPVIYLPPVTGKPEQQRFTMRSGVLTSISSRQHSATSGRPNERTLDPHETVIDAHDIISEDIQLIMCPLSSMFLIFNLVCIPFFHSLVRNGLV